MEIIVLIKQVPDTASGIPISDDGKSINSNDIKWVMNPYDELAVEEALRIKQKCGGIVTIIAVGTKKTVDIIRKGMAMGADRGVLVDDPDAYNSDALGTAKIIAALLKKLKYNLIIAGQRAVDYDQYQVGASVAEFLDIPNVSLVTKVDLKDNSIICCQSVEGGSLTVEVSLPALITTERGLNEPRFTSMAGIMKAKRKPLENQTLKTLNLDPAQFGIKGSKVKVLSLTYPQERKGGKIIEGETASEKAKNLVKALHEEVKVI